MATQPPPFGQPGDPQNPLPLVARRPSAAETARQRARRGRPALWLGLIPAGLVFGGLLAWSLRPNAPPVAQRAQDPEPAPTPAPQTGVAESAAPAAESQEVAADSNPADDEPTGVQSSVEADEPPLAQVTPAAEPSEPTPMPSAQPAPRPGPGGIFRDVLARARLLPVPDDAALEQARLDLTADLEAAAAAQSAPELSDAGQALIAQAIRSDDAPARQFALLQAAVEVGHRLATINGHLRLADEALAELQRRFQFDPFPQREATLQAAGAFAQSPADRMELARSWAGLAVEAMHNDDPAAAERCADRAVTTVKPLGNPILAARMQTLQADLRLAAEAYDAYAELVQSFRAAVAAGDASDEALAAQWARFACLCLNNWEDFLAAWAAGAALENPPAGAALAAEDVARPRDPAQQLALAEAWWQFASECTLAVETLNAQGRAAYWYQTAAAELPAGERETAWARCDEVLRRALPLDFSRPVELLPGVELRRHLAAGYWWQENGGLETQLEQAEALFRLPVAPTGSYELHVECSIKKGRRLVLILPVGARRTGLVVDGGSDDATGLSDAGPGGPAVNGTAASAGTLLDGKRHTLLIRVEAGELEAAIEAQLDGRPWIAWRGEAATLRYPSLLSADSLACGAPETVAVFHSIRLRVLDRFVRMID